jgi:predicted ester cyclase
VNHDPYNPDQGVTRPEGLKQRVSGYRNVFHDFDLRIEQQLAEGDMVDTHWSVRGTHRGELEGTPPTGKSVYVEGQLLSHIVDGKFVEEWVHWDTLGLLRQIGPSRPPKPDRASAATEPVTWQKGLPAVWSQSAVAAPAVLIICPHIAGVGTAIPGRKRPGCAGPQE